MSDYDLQFQADLEKAQALSLESLALEQFRRQKQLNNTTVSRDIRDGSASSAREPPPALPPPPRRPSRASRPSVSENPRTPSASPNRENPDSDLISFSSPTSKTAPDPHASFKEYIEQINKLGQQTEELTIVAKDQSPLAMNPYPYGSPGYPMNPGYVYNYPPPYPQMPYPPASPYGMPSPMAGSPHVYYSPPQDMQYSPGTPPVYYTQTRMAAPPVYPVYPPATPPTPQHYNYSTTNMISRPIRPANLYPQLPQMHTYPQMPVNSVMQSNNSLGNEQKPTVERNVSRKTSEVSTASNESSDTLGSLPQSLNLIDFGKAHSSQGSVRVSVLEAFDPLLTEQNNSEYAVPSECSSSVYEEYDPLDFLYGETELREAPVYATVSKKDTTILPSPPPKSIPSVPAVQKRASTNKLYDCVVKLHTKNYDSELKAFLKMVLDVRKEFVCSDTATNPGYVVAARSGGKYAPNTSIKVVVHHAHSDEPITFTSDVESTIDHVILTVVCSLDEDIRDDMSGYMLRVYGANEYLKPGSSLSEYDYVRECVRLEKDVKLYLNEGIDNSLARTEADDARAAHITLDDLVPSEGAPMLTFDSLSILFETLEMELSRASGTAAGEGRCSPAAVFQAVKAVCALAGGIETLHLTHTLNAFSQAAANQIGSGVTPEITHDVGAYSNITLRRASARESLAAQAARVRDAVRALVATYTRTHLVDVAVTGVTHQHNVAKAIPSHTITESTLLCVEAVHHLGGGWTHDEYVVHAHVYHGTRQLHRVAVTNSSRIESAGFYPRIIFDTWLNLEELPISALPREARLVLTLYGRTQQAEKNNDNNGQTEDTEENQGSSYNQEELGWTALQLFDFDGILASGNYFLPLWGVGCDKRIPPAPSLFDKPPNQHPVINIEIPLYTGTGVKFSTGAKVELRREVLPKFDSLDGHTQSQLLHLIEQGTYQRMPTEGREVMWEKRQYLVELPGALSLILLSANNWYGEHREHLIALMNLWEKPSPLNALHLLLPCFPDASVREYACSIISTLDDDSLSRLLPQLVEGWARGAAAGAGGALLLRGALRAPRLAHRLLTLLPQSQPESLGISIEESGSSVNHVCHAGDAGTTCAWRMKLLARAVTLLCGERLAHAMSTQHQLVQMLSETAQSVKSAKEGARQRALVSGATALAAAAAAAGAVLPLSPAATVRDVDVKSCSYFSSNTLPLKINFIGCDNVVIPAMFKVGDDLRQDALVLQIIKVMDIFWLQAGLDLRMVTFQALPTGPKKGMIEIVQEAETLRAIQTEWGLTGSFKDKPIAEWLAKHNPSELEYQRARDNFTASVAGYSVATYLLGICDRHNDNIMLKTSGHLFHIDFGKFLGDAQMFGNFKRDRAPFVLTPDMVYVINGGERPSQRFHHFVELCCMAFNIVRAHRSHILDLIALMATSGVCGVTSAAVGHVRAALLPAATSAEAAAAFARLIHSSLRSKFTPINFFLHNLAQLRASGDQSSNTSELLSFMPRTYTMAQEGRLVSVECLGFEKRYDPEKHYVYALRVFRQGHATPAVLYRSYRHFTELYQKICLHFPLAKVHSLPSGLHVGRSNIRQVAERRFGDVQAFLTSLFSLADEIAHSDLVYTFFHPLLRDQQDVVPQRTKNKDAVTESLSPAGSGALKLSVQYAGGVLAVLILHAQSLALTPQGLPPNPYVKVYLVPDPTKETKRKTKVLKRNSHPSFMEMLEYRLPLEVVRSRSLQATVWHYDSLQENQFLGGVVIPLDNIDLREETVGWYTLEYIPR